MENVFLIFLIIVGVVSCGYDYICDYRFGDPSWKYSQVFHNKSHVIPSGTTHRYIYLTETDLMISFVCVNLTRVNPKRARVSFASLFKRISIQFSEPYSRDVTADVLAMHHGYLRFDHSHTSNTVFPTVNINQEIKEE